MSRLTWGIALSTSALAGLVGFSASAAPKSEAAAPAKPAAPAPGAAATPDKERFFTQEVLPLLKEKCISCHSGESVQGGLRLSSRDAILKGGASGPAVDLKKPDQSLFVTAIHYKGRRMPPQGKLPPKQIETLTRWVREGLVWPAGEHASLEPKNAHGAPQVTPETMKFWAYQPVKRPAVPAVKNKAWVRSPIDAFVLAGLEKEGLKPNPTASREVLIRRATYDLTGLPPTAEEVEAFVNDRSPNAWEKVVDRLLASPQYGEKWGRHWLDLVRYAETNSYERDGTKPNAWRYRDYVIDSFNADKPYDQFVLEQLAGDELAQRTPERLIATGFYRMGIWDDEPADPKQALYDDLDDIANTTGQVFLGMSVGCARCHDHKIDPLPIKDYYSFLSFFSGVRRYGIRSNESVAEASLRPIASEEEIRKQQAEVAAHQAKVKEVTDAMREVERKVFPDLEPVEKEEWRTEFRRLPIVRKRVGKILTQEEFDGYSDLSRQRRDLFRNQPRALDSALVVTEEKQPRETFILLRGNPHSPGDKVEPAFPAVLAPPKPVVEKPAHGESSGRRLALAKWIASPQNPLTSRVMVNRVWQYHFGRGIVKSSNDFGFQGSRPTHPALLEWLAAEFPARGWKLKPLHREIMLSNTYKMSSAGNPAALKKDPANDLIWRYDMRRLQAEELRDSILWANGSLNLKAGGPSIYPDIPAEVLAGQSMPGAGWGKSSPEEQRRRSVYIFVKRSLAVPIIASFDGPETDFTCPQRFATTQPTQSLGMMNSQWINEQAGILAEYLKKNAGTDPAAQVRLALQRVTQRKPTQAEVDRGLKLMRALQDEEKLGGDDALRTFCVVALNLNEFVYLD